MYFRSIWTSNVCIKSQIFLKYFKSEAKSLSRSSLFPDSNLREKSSRRVLLVVGAYRNPWLTKKGGVLFIIAFTERGTFSSYPGIWKDGFHKMKYIQLSESFGAGTLNFIATGL